MPVPLTRDRIVADIAEITGVPAHDIDDSTNVLDTGLDSVRLMALVERWRVAGADQADLVTLASEPYVGAWVRELTGAEAAK
ncbi:MAG: phosphopantetheine-binding protein [Gordonia sp. (in: high G+C Gram-positive bacteria)]